MLFRDASCNVEIDLIHVAFCKITILNGDAAVTAVSPAESPMTVSVADGNVAQLRRWMESLDVYVNKTFLERGLNVQFVHNVSPEERCMVVTGSIIAVIHALHSLGYISDALHDDVITQVTLDMLKQSLEAISPERREIFKSKIQALVDSWKESLDDAAASSSAIRP